ncbi:MAG: tRNA (guanosine(37)-N1)-methyltransferase TrmD [Myxococcota bacterium]
MRFTVVTIFPGMFESVLASGVLGRAIEAGRLTVDFVDPRDFTRDRHRTVDDTPYGGGPGMVMKVEPLVAAIESVMTPGCHRVLLSPRGTPMGQRQVRSLGRHEQLILVCGRYEGIDERVSQLTIDEELSVGDFVLSGGEVAAMAVIDAVARYIPGVLGEATSTDEESFAVGLLEYPHYTRPAQFRGVEVPEVLVSGNHGRIARWRRERSLAITAERRPALLARYRPAEDEREQLAALPPAGNAARVYVALVHHPVIDRYGAVVTSAITNLDVHDIARSCATYGLAGYVVVTPVAAQRDKVERILSAWHSGQQQGADNRIDALSLVRASESIEQAGQAIAAEHGQAPLLVATSARSDERQSATPAISFGALQQRMKDRDERPVLLLFGTAWGLSESAIEQSDQVLTLISGRPTFNHLSVRSAVAIVLDRLFGLRE